MLHLWSIQNTSETVRTQEQKEQMKEHLAEKQATYTEHKSDQLKPENDPNFKCVSFDLEKVLNTPCGNSM